MALTSLRRGEVAAVLVATFVIFLGFNFFYAGFPVHAMESYGWGAGELGIYFAVLSGMMMVAQGPVLTWVSRRAGPRSVFVAGMGCLTLSLAALAQPAGILTFLSAVLFATGNGLAWPTFQARVAEVAGDQQGSIQGAATSAGSLASICGLIGGGILYAPLGGRLFYLAAALFAVVLILTPVWFRGEAGR